MSHRKGTLGGLNIHQAAQGTKRLSSGKGQAARRVRKATQEVIANAMTCGLTLDQALEVAASALPTALEIIAHPEREAEIRRKADRATVGVVVAVRSRRAVAA
jgi:hypothetical protein